MAFETLEPIPYAERYDDARALYERHQWSGCGGTGWDGLDQHARDAWLIATALIANQRNQVDTVLHEYEEHGPTPAPFTSERALYERMCHSIDREPTQ